MTKRFDTEKDIWPIGLLTLAGLADALAKSPALQSVCSDGNSDAHSVARELAIMTMDYLSSVASSDGEQSLQPKDA